MDTFLFVLRAATPIINVVFKVILIGVLVWIGQGLEKVTVAIHAGSEACTINPDAIKGTSEFGEPSGLTKPQFHEKL